MRACRWRLRARLEADLADEGESEGAAEVGRRAGEAEVAGEEGEGEVAPLRRVLQQVAREERRLEMSLAAFCVQISHRYRITGSDAEQQHGEALRMSAACMLHQSCSPDTLASLSLGRIAVVEALPHMPRLNPILVDGLR